MNLGLLDPFQTDFPEVIEDRLCHSNMKSLAFNRRGTLLAAGCHDGSCVIWDFDTRGVAKELTSDFTSLSITSVSWSKTGHKLLGASQERILLWDVMSGKIDITVEFDSPVTGAYIHLKDSSLCLVCLTAGSPVLVNLRDGSKRPLLRELVESDGKASVESDGKAGVESDGKAGGDKSQLRGAMTMGGEDRGGGTGRSGKGGNAGACDSPAVSATAATFNKRGDLVYIGNSKGEVLLVDVASQNVLGVVMVSPGSAIRQVAFDRSGDCLLTNSNDRIIRIFTNLLPLANGAEVAAQIAQAANAGLSSGSPTAGVGGMKGGGSARGGLPKSGGKGYEFEKGSAFKKQRSPFLRRAKDFQDVVNRCPWKVACFSGDSEYVLGASALRAEHKIHIWNRNFGQLVRILEGPKEGILDLVWHPTRPIVASVATSGIVYLWAKGYIENWSAFAPDFKELEENEEYVEREDEFDQVQEEKVKPAMVEEDEEVDIITVDKVPAYSDSDNSEDGLYFLPTAPEPDPPPKGWENHENDVVKENLGEPEEKEKKEKEKEKEKKEKEKEKKVAQKEDDKVPVKTREKSGEPGGIDPIVKERKRGMSEARRTERGEVLDNRRGGDAERDREPADEKDGLVGRHDDAEREREEDPADNEEGSLEEDCLQTDSIGRKPEERKVEAVKN